ncbi:MAG: GntR family transcriptional regulator [Ilumatobacteraceae bacterium]
MAVRSSRPSRSGGPLWAQVLADLRKRLAAGEFAAQFPTDRELMLRYKVSRHTAREAVRRLQAEGQLTRHKGRGSFVQSINLEQQVGSLYSLFRSIEDQGHIQRSEVLALDTVCDADVARRMGLAASTTFVHLRRLRRADGVPFAVDEVWLPHPETGALLDSDFEHTALYSELERTTGLRPVRGWERIRPGIPDDDERRLLDIDDEQAIFVVQRYTESDAGPLEWRTTVIRGDNYTFRTTWSTPTESARFTLLPLRPKS